MPAVENVAFWESLFLKIALLCSLLSPTAIGYQTTERQTRGTDVVP
jgi:hypothetical protein